MIIKNKNFRKMILCALNRHDLAAAREMFHRMPASSKTAPLTQYLMFKVSLRSGDREQGESSA
jgi:hypothetical protein